MSLQSFFVASGFAGWIIIVMSIVALAITLLKWWQFASLKLSDRVTMDSTMAAIEAADLAGAKAKVLGVRNPRAIVLSAYLDHANTLNPAALNDELMRIASQQIALLTGYLKPLEVIAVLTPLLGLFGTVLGMIEAFQAMEAAGSQVSPEVLSGGIWKALLTTAEGLAVAIPATMAFNYFDSRVEYIARGMQDDIARIATFLQRNERNV